MNRLQQFGRAVGGVFAAAAAALNPSDSVPPRPVPAVVMPETTPLPRPRPDSAVAGLAAPGAESALPGEVDAGRPSAAGIAADAASITQPVALEAVQLAFAASIDAEPGVLAVGVPLPPPRPRDGAAAALAPALPVPPIVEAEGDAVPPGGDAVADAAAITRPVAEEAVRLAFAAPEIIIDPTPFAAVGIPLPEPRPDADAEEQAGLPPIPAPRPDPNAPRPAESRAAGPHSAVPGSRPGETQVAALAPTTPALIARLNDNPPSPACIARLLELGVEFEILDPIATDTGCGTSQPLRVRALREGSVRLDPPATLDCAMVETLVDWIEDEVQPAARAEFEARVTGLSVAASYSCRGVNGASSGPLSEHAYANALDVSAFEVGGETEIAVLAQEDPETPTAQFLGEVRGSACEHFHTVLGPGSDEAHWNHFHLDLAPRGRHGDSRFCQ